MSGGRPERIGVLGGTFDPVHVGHVAAASTVRHALLLDRLLLTVANVPWQKRGTRRITDAEDRYAMVAAAVAGINGLEPSRLEIDRGGETYTSETLVQLAEIHPGAELFCVVGSDVADELHTWHHAEEVGRLATIVVVDRPGSSRVSLGPGWRVRRVEIPRLDVSSTQLRDRVAGGWPLDGLVPPAALHWIRRRGLYADRD